MGTTLLASLLGSRGTPQLFWGIRFTRFGQRTAWLGQRGSRLVLMTSRLSNGKLLHLLVICQDGLNWGDEPCLALALAFRPAKARFLFKLQPLPAHLHCVEVKIYELTYLIE